MKNIFKILLMGTTVLTIVMLSLSTFLFGQGPTTLVNSEDTAIGAQITCKCSKLKDQNCAANNWGANCASGENIKCWEYNLNCNY